MTILYMIVNTNRVLLEIFTNTTIDKPKNSDSLTEFISLLFVVAIIACCCCLNYNKSFNIEEGDRRSSNYETKELREINLEIERGKQEVIQV